MAGTGLSKNLVSSSARSGVSGDPVDPGRVEIFESLYHERVKKGYSGYPDKNITQLAYRKKSSFLAGEKRKEAFHEYVYLLAKRYYQSYLNFSAEVPFEGFAIFCVTEYLYMVSFIFGNY